MAYIDYDRGYRKGTGFMKRQILKCAGILALAVLMMLGCGGSALSADAAFDKAMEETAHFTKGAIHTFRVPLDANDKGVDIGFQGFYHMV